jgi:hypothetical protein
MALNGHLSTIPIPDLLQWLNEARQSGVLTVERRGVRKRIYLRDGALVGCSTDDPPSRLGQVLLSRGHIEEDQLREALSRQEQVGKDIGTLLIEMGALDESTLKATLKSKAEETIYSLFDWDEAVFRFDARHGVDPYVHDLEIDLQGTLMKGVQRYDEMRRFRTAFPDPGVVLQCANKKAPEKLKESRIAARIFELVNGERTLAEILIHARVSEYLVMKFLFELHRRELVRIVEIQSLEEETLPALQTLEDPPSVDPSVVVEAGGELAEEMRVVDRLEARKEVQLALELLQSIERAWPGEAEVRHRLARAEASFVREHANMDPTMIPVLKAGADESVRRHLSPEASFLPSMIDGRNDVQSIVWLAPIHAVDVMRALQQLIDADQVELRPAPPEVQASAS